MQRPALPFLVFFLTLVLFLPWMTHENFIEFEARYVVFAKVMINSSWSPFPMLYGEYYPDYLSTGTTLIVLGSLINHVVTPMSAIFPTAFASASMLGLMFAFGEKERSSWGSWAVVLTLLTFGFVTEARTISPDQWVSLAALMSFVGLCRERSMMIIMGFLIGFLFRGSMGVVIPAGIVCVNYLAEKEWRQCFRIGLIALCIIGLGMLLMLGVAHYLGGARLFHQVLQMQVFSRLVHDAAAPPWHYYATTSLAHYSLVFPLALVVCVCLFRSFKDKTFRRCVIASLVILIGMSLAGDKKSRYILAVVPYLSLIAAYPLALRNKKFELGYLGLFSCIPLFGFIALFAFMSKSSLPYLNEAWFKEAGIMLCTLFILALWVQWKFPRRALTLNAVMAVISFFIIIVGVYEPLLQAHDATLPLVEKIEKQCPERGKLLVFYRMSRDGNVLKYLANIPDHILPIFIEKQDNIPVHICTISETPIDMIGFRELFQEQLGHSKVFVGIR